MVCSRREIPATALALPLRLHPGLHHHSLRLPPHRLQGTGHPGTRNPGAEHPDILDIQAPGSPVSDTQVEVQAFTSGIHVRQGKGTWHPLQRQNTEISKQIFPEKEYRGLSPNFHIHVSVSDLYISTIGLPILLEEICRPILGLYKSLTDT